MRLESTLPSFLPVSVWVDVREKVSGAAMFPSLLGNRVCFLLLLNPRPRSFTFMEKSRNLILRVPRRSPTPAFEKRKSDNTRCAFSAFCSPARRSPHSPQSCRSDWEMGAWYHLLANRLWFQRLVDEFELRSAAQCSHRTYLRASSSSFSLSLF